MRKRLSSLMCVLFGLTVVWSVLNREEVVRTGVPTKRFNAAESAVSKMPDEPTLELTYSACVIEPDEGTEESTFMASINRTQSYVAADRDDGDSVAVTGSDPKQENRQQVRYGSEAYSGPLALSVTGSAEQVDRSEEQKRANEEANAFSLATIVNNDNSQSEPGDGTRPTGLVRPTPEQETKSRKHVRVVRKVSLNKIGFARINEERRKKGLPQLVAGKDVQVAPMGQDVISVPAAALEVPALNAAPVAAPAAEEHPATVGSAIEGAALNVAPIAPAAAEVGPAVGGEPIGAPAAVDNSTLQYFPPIRHQSGSSCAGWSAIYYNTTHEVAMLREWNAKSGGDDYRLTPVFSWNFLNGGQNQGTTLDGHYDIARKHGIPRWSQFYTTSARTWCTDPDVYRSALNDRISGYHGIYSVDTESGLNQLKDYLNNGHTAAYSTYIGSWQYKTVANDPGTADDDAYVGKSIAYSINGTRTGHGMTIVGYNDNLWCDIDGDGVVDSDEKGALRIANSWGTGWKDGGYTWVSYAALSTGIFTGNKVYGASAGATPHAPTVVARITLNHNLRNQVFAHLCIGEVGAGTPSDYSWPAIVDDQGGPYAFNGDAPVSQDFTYYLDFTELAPSEGMAKRWFVRISDDGLNDGNLQIKDFRLYATDSGPDELVGVAANTPLEVNGYGDYKLAWIDWTVSERPELTVASAHGTAVPSGVTTPASNSVVNASIVDSPVLIGNTQYVCTGWVGSGSLTSGSGTNVIFTITNDTTITWQWETNTVVVHAVTFNEGVYGSRVGGGSLTQTVVEATSAAVPLITPDAGYTFDGWDSSAYTNVMNSMTINAQYSAIEYTLNYSAGVNGSLVGTQTQTVTHGSSGSAVTALPDGGYHFVNWSDGSADNPRTDSGVTDDVAVTASFSPNTPAAADNGSGATSLTETSARLSGDLTGGADATAWVCWGITDGGTSSTGDWDSVVLVGAVSQGVPFSTSVTSLSTNTTYFYRCYVVNAYGAGWSDSAESFAGIPVGGVGAGVSVAVGEWDFEGAGGRGGGVSLPPWRNSSSGGNSISIEGYSSLSSKVDVPPGGGSYCHYNNGSGDSIYQVLSTNLEANTTYTLSVVAMDRTDLIFRSSELRLGYAPGTDDGSTGDLIANHFYGEYLLTANVLTNTIPINGAGTNDGYVTWVSEFTTGESPAGEGSPIRIEIVGSGVQSLFDNVKLSLVGSAGGVAVANRAPTGITTSASTFNASLSADGTEYDAYVYYGTSDGGTNAGSWASSAYVGSWTNVSTNVSYAASSLMAGETYYYAFMASNATESVWATPSWRLATIPSSGPVTTNHSVPHAWIDSVATNVISDYEAAVLEDQDNDGFSTWQEYWSGTDPFSGDSYLCIDAIRFDGSNVALEWRHAQVDPAIPPIAIEARTDLSTGVWLRVGEKSPVNGANTWNGPLASQYFYRLVVTNAP